MDRGKSTVLLCSDSASPRPLKSGPMLNIRIVVDRKIRPVAKRRLRATTAMSITYVNLLDSFAGSRSHTPTMTSTNSTISRSLRSVRS